MFIVVFSVIIIRLRASLDTDNATSYAMNKLIIIENVRSKAKCYKVETYCI